MVEVALQDWHEVSLQGWKDLRIRRAAGVIEKSYARFPATPTTLVMQRMRTL